MRALLFSFLCLIEVTTNSFVWADVLKSQGNWHGKQAAVVLTYDDALDVHLDNVIPKLNSLGVNATFYLTTHFSGFKQRQTEWQLAAQLGHELGNHTKFHPCNGHLPGREWVSPSQDLSTWQKENLLNNIQSVNVHLFKLDKRKKRTFAFPCGDLSVGNVSYKDDIAKRFIAARGVEFGYGKLDELDRHNLPSFLVNQQSFKELRTVVDSAIEKRALVIFMFHGVGGGHVLDVELDVHNKFIDYIHSQKELVWIAPLVDIADFIVEKTQFNK